MAVVRRMLMSGVAIWAAAASAGGDIQVVVEASRTGCTAPCSIHFDTSGTQHSEVGIDPFTDLEYLWDFGDPDSGQWTLGSVRGPRTSAIGPLAAHVFERPGSYRVRVRVFDALGEESEAEVLIAVADPDAVFAAEATTCLARDGLDWTGCPQGARREIGSAVAAAYASFGGAGRRLLLRRGDSFQASSSLRAVGLGPGQVGAFGSGAAPRLQQGEGANCLEVGSTQQATRDFSFFDLHCEKPAANHNDFSTAMQHPAAAELQPVQHVLFGRIEASGYSSLQGGPLLGDPARERIRHFTLYEVRESGPITPGAFVINFPLGRDMAWLGVKVDRSAETCITTNSVLRSSGLQRIVIAQSEFTHSCTGPLRLHSSPSNDPDAERPEKLVVTRSIIGGINPSSGAAGGNGGPVSVEPGVSAGAQIRDYVFEGNLVRYGAANNSGFDWSGRNFIARNNLFDLRGTAGNGDAFAVFTKNGGDHGATSRIRFVHNTVFQLQGGPWQETFANHEGASDVRAFNNALRTVEGSLPGALISAGFAEAAGNVVAGPATPNPLVQAIPAYGALSEYCPRVGGSFSGAAGPRRAALDVFGRPRGVAPSAGFCELSVDVFADGFEP